jgi:hypothetical protein
MKLFRRKVQEKEKWLHLFPCPSPNGEDAAMWMHWSTYPQMSVVLYYTWFQARYMLFYILLQKKNEY